MNICIEFKDGTTSSECDLIFEFIDNHIPCHVLSGEIVVESCGQACIDLYLPPCDSEDQSAANEEDRPRLLDDVKQVFWNMLCDHKDVAWFEIEIIATE